MSSRFCRRVAPLGVAIALAATIAAPVRAATPRRVGTVPVHPCRDGYPGVCGHIERALDPILRGGPRIPIHFEWIPARHPVRGRHATTIVAVEGGPGYPSTGTYGEYLGTFGPTLAHHNLLMVDNRGTGRSALIRCRALDRYPATGSSVGPAFDRIVARCAHQLDHSYRGPHGHDIHAADLFATAYAVRDLRAVLARLDTGRVELYGDSYGSWFTQAFMARYPGLLSSVILDSTYPIADLDPYYASSGLSGRRAMDRVCLRDPGCHADEGTGTPVTRLGALRAIVRRRPIHATVVTGHGLRPVTVTPRTLVNLFQDGGSDPYIWREYDASVRAALAGDDAPLARLALYDATDGGDSDPGYFSDGDYMAVSCTDYPQLFSRTAPVRRRPGELARSIASAPAGVFRPFSAPEFTSMYGYDETYDSCLDWPAPVHHQPVLPPAGQRPLPARVPLLIVGGDIDDLTPLHDVRRFGPHLGADVRIVDLHNTVHVTSEGDTYLDDGARCARLVIDRFVRHPARLQQLRAGCAARIPHVHTPGAYPLLLAAATSARRVAGPQIDSLARRAVTVAAGALADATIRSVATGHREGAGLRGGTWSERHGRFTLRRVRFVSDATVTGTGAYRPSDGATRGRLVVAYDHRRVHVSLAWTQRSREARARVGATGLLLPAP